MTRPESKSEPLRLERLLSALPRTEAVRPLASRLLGSSHPDEKRRWTASGELGTAAGRVVDVQAYRDDAAAWVAEEGRRLQRRAEAVASVADGLARGVPGQAVTALLDESGALEADGAPKEAEAWADAAFRMALETGDPRAAQARRRGARCARAQGALARSAEAYEDAWARAVEAGLEEDAVVAATGRGNVSVDRGLWRDAEAWYRRALEVLDDPKHGLGDVTARGLRWRLCQNLGITHRERGDLDGSEAWYRRAEEASLGLDDPAAVVEIENGRGQLALARGDLQAAEGCFRRALAALTDPQPDPVRVAVRSNLAEALLLRGRTLEAGMTAREAEAEAIRGRHVARLPEVYRVLGRILAARGEAEAFVLVERGLEIARDAGLPPLQEALTLSTWADLREAQGEDDLARQARARAEELLTAPGDQRAHRATDEDHHSPAGGAS